MGSNLPVTDLGKNGVEITQLAAGEEHNCALFKDHELKCWGHNGEGMLGLEDLISRGIEPGQMGSALPVVDVLGPK